MSEQLEQAVLWLRAETYLQSEAGQIISYLRVFRSYDDIARILVSFEGRNNDMGEEVA